MTPDIDKTVELLWCWLTKINYQLINLRVRGTGKYKIKAISKAKELFGQIDESLTRHQKAVPRLRSKTQKKTNFLQVTSINSDLIHLTAECQT